MRKSLFVALTMGSTLAACSPYRSDDNPAYYGKLAKRVGNIIMEKPRYRTSEARPTTREETARMIIRTAKEEGLDPKFVLAVAHVESGINPNVGDSWAGAIGVMQVMPGTARQFDPNLTYAQIKDPRINIPLGVRYLKLGMQQANGNWRQAAARYEAGLWSGRKDSAYSNKVARAKTNGIVLSHLGEGPSISTAFIPERFGGKPVAVAKNQLVPDNQYSAPKETIIAYTKAWDGMTAFSNAKGPVYTLKFK